MGGFVGQPSSPQIKFELAEFIASQVHLPYTKIFNFF